GPARHTLGAVLGVHPDPVLEHIVVEVTAAGLRETGIRADCRGIDREWIERRPGRFVIGRPRRRPFARRARRKQGPQGAENRLSHAAILAARGPHRSDLKLTPGLRTPG